MCENFMNVIQNNNNHSIDNNVPHLNSEYFYGNFWTNIVEKTKNKNIRRIFQKLKISSLFRPIETLKVKIHF